MSKISVPGSCLAVSIRERVRTLRVLKTVGESLLNIGSGPATQDAKSSDWKESMENLTAAIKEADKALLLYDEPSDLGSVVSNPRTLQASVGSYATRSNELGKRLDKLTESILMYLNALNTAVNAPSMRRLTSPVTPSVVDGAGDMLYTFTMPKK